MSRLPNGPECRKASQGLNDQGNPGLPPSVQELPHALYKVAVSISQSKSSRLAASRSLGFERISPITSIQGCTPAQVQTKTFAWRDEAVPCAVNPDLSIPMNRHQKPLARTLTGQDGTQIPKLAIMGREEKSGVEGTA